MKIESDIVLLFFFTFEHYIGIAQKNILLCFFVTIAKYKNLHTKNDHQKLSFFDYKSGKIGVNTT